MLIIKIGGGETLNLPGIVEDLSRLDEPFLIVHGANALRDRIAQRMGYPKKVITSVSGYSSVFSDETALDAILMAYSGLRNKRLVELCQQNSINAVGLTGLDGRVIQGQRNRGIRVIENGKKMMKHDYSGKPKKINVDLLMLLLSNGYTPVLTIPICDQHGSAINSENDDIVCQLQAAVNADTVIQLIEAPGLMENINDPDSVIATLHFADLAQRVEQLHGRMKRKLYALDKLTRGNIKRIILSDGRRDRPLRDALAGGGTWITP